MALGKRRRKRRKIGLAGAEARRAKKAKLLETQQKEFEKFRDRYPKFGEALDEIREKALEGYQIPKSDYEVGDHLQDVYELVLQMGEQRKAILAELDQIYSRRSGANKYLALLKAASAPGYNEKMLSKGAQRIRVAFKDRVPLDDFETHRKAVRKKQTVSKRRQ